MSFRGIDKKIDIKRHSNFVCSYVQVYSRGTSYSSAGCSPAEPASVSPDVIKILFLL